MGEWRRPSPSHPFVILARASVLAVAGAGIVLARGQGWFVAWALLALLRVPSRSLVVQNAIVVGVAALVAVHAGEGALPWGGAVAGIALVALLAPESAHVALTSQDRLFIAQEHGLVAMNSIHVLDARGSFDREALKRAVDALAREVPMLRSFVRETWWSCERFATRVPWFAPVEVVDFAPDAAAAEARLAATIDLGREPPFRVVLSPGPEASVERLVFLVHHSAVDGDAGLRLFARLLRRYNEAVGAAPVASLAPLPVLVPGPRLRRLLARRGVGWTWRMIRAHFHPLRKSGVVNATLIDDAGDVPSRVRARVSEVSRATFDALKGTADALGVTRNDLLVAASMRAVDAHLRDLGRPERSICLLLPSSLRADLAAPECLNNYVGAIPVSLSAEAVRSHDLPVVLSSTIKSGRALDIAVGAAVNVGMVGALFPLGTFRSGLRKLDLDIKSSYFTYLISSPRIPRDFDVPAGLATERVFMHGPLTRRPAFGFVLTVFDGRVVVVYEYLSPAVSEASVDSIDRRFHAEVERLATPRGP